MEAFLANTLQAVQQAQRSSLNPLQQQVWAIVQQNQSKAQSVEDQQLQAQALSLMPLQQWRQAAAEQVELNRLLEPGQSTAAVEDLVMKSMLQWFKQDFFSWVNNPPCSTCGSSSTLATGMAAPTAAEQPHAARVEVYTCSVCGQATRFPRYTTPGKLLESRRGRCGEWAHCFLLMLRAAGYDARHVTDNADHVWNEYHSNALGRWVHVDACEAAWDTPLLYEGGWGKTLGYVLAASCNGHADVTRRYVLPTALQQLPSRRAGVPEQWLQFRLAQATTRLRAHLGAARRRSLAVRDTAELLQLLTLDGAAMAAATAAAAANLPGRQSGAEAWRQARGETGSASNDRPAPRPPTAFTYARDAALPELFAAAGRITGGACRASGGHTGGTPSQVMQRLFDGALGSKWLDFGGGGIQGAAWVEYRLLPQADAVRVTHYDVISAEDCPERDPCDWVLEALPCGSSSSGSSSGGSSGASDGSWVVLHEVRAHTFSRRHQLCSFVLPQAAHVASRTWRLRVTRVANPSTATCVQLACWNLYSTQAACRARQLLYMDSSMCEQLQAAASAAAGPAGASAAGASAGSSSDVAPEGLSTLKRILGNMAQPGAADPKFFKLSVKAAKLQQLLADPLLRAAVFAAGFRPLLHLPSAAEPQPQLVLVAGDSSSGVQSAGRVLLRLLEGGDGNTSASTADGAQSTV